MNKLPESMPEGHDLHVAKTQAKKIIRDIYGRNTKNADILNYKLDKCENVIQVDKVLAWGRVNLL